MYLDAGYEQDNQELAYARQAILYVPKEDREKMYNIIDSTIDVFLQGQNNGDKES